MKTNSLLLILFIWAIGSISKPSLAQDGNSITWAPTKKSKIRPLAFISKDEDGNYVYHAYRISSIPLPYFTLLRIKDYVRIYDSELKFIKDVKLDLPKVKTNIYKLKTSDFRAFTEFKDKICLVYTTKKGQKQQMLMMREFNPNTLELGSAQAIAPVRNEEGKRYETPRITVSQDKSKMLIFYRIKKSKSDKAVVSYFVVDQEGSLLSNGICTFDSESKYVADYEAHISNNGDVVILEKVRISRKEKKSQKENEDSDDAVIQNYKFFVHIVKKGDKTAKKVPYEVKDRLVANLSAKMSGKDEFLLFGGFSPNRMNQYFAAPENYLFSASMDFEGKILLEDYPPDEAAEEDDKARTKKEKRNDRKTAVGNYDMISFDHSFYTSDSSYYLVGETYTIYMYTTTTTSRTGTTTTTTTQTRYKHHYGNIYIIKFNKEGEFVGREMIRKDTRYDLSTGTRQSEYKPVEHNGDLHILYMDLAVSKKSEKKRKKRKSDLSVRLAKVDGQTVKASSQMLSSLSRDKEFIKPNLEKASLVDNRIIFLGYKGLTGKKVSPGYVEIH
jgi:hypothetical protein